MTTTASAPSTFVRWSAKNGCFEDVTEMQPDHFFHAMKIEQERGDKPELVAFMEAYAPVMAIRREQAAQEAAARKAARH